MSGIVLASTSPRRRALLREAGIEHDAVSPGVDDSELTYTGSVSPAGWVLALAYLKARAGLREVKGGDTPEARPVVIGADTVVARGVEVMGQPSDAAAASVMVSALVDGEHEVLTGVAVVDGDRRVLFVDRSDVRVGAVDSDSVASYVESGEWAGKAGGYNLADRVAAGWPIEVEGDPLSVMGLPVSRVVDALEGFGVGVVS